jgi:hypothetical protein
MWRQVWNTHKMQLKGERDQSPRELFFFGIITRGARGLSAALVPAQAEDGAIGNAEEYGIDWEEYEDERLMANFLSENPDDHEDEFIPGQPGSLSIVDVVSPNCPLTAEEVSHLTRLLSLRVDCQTTAMLGRRLMWTQALELCIAIIAGRGE